MSRYRTRAEARADICDYIERCHNPRTRRRLEVQQQGVPTLHSTIRDIGVETHVVGARGESCFEREEISWRVLFVSFFWFNPTHQREETN